MSSQRCRCALPGKSSPHLAIGLVDVLGIARQRHPAERSLSFAEQRADVGGHEARERERIGDALVERYRPDIVAVIERRDARFVEREHRADVRDDRSLRRGDERRVLRGVGLRRAPAFDRPSGGQVAVDEIVRGSLVRHQRIVNSSVPSASGSGCHGLTRPCRGRDGVVGCCRTGVFPRRASGARASASGDRALGERRHAPIRRRTRRAVDGGGYQAMR